MGELFQPYDGRTAPSPISAPPAPVRSRWGALALATLVLLCLYTLFRATAYLDATYRVWDRLAADLLLAAELFIFVHALGYLLSTIKARRAAATDGHLLAAFGEPAVAILVTSFNESPEVLEETLAAVAALDYGRKRLYLVDDSTKAEARRGADALARRYGATVVRRENRRGYKAGAINDLLPDLTEPYLLILDADCRPVANFLRDVVPLIDADPCCAFVQTPQFYERTAALPVAFAAAMQQAVFYEYICEGKSAVDAMFCCGTNVIFRRAALLAIGRPVDDRLECFDESSVTEDFATSLLLHQGGWRSRYFNRVYAYGMGPETLAAYFTQQMRWALGTLGICRRLLRECWVRPRSLHLGQWWEYFLSATYYFVGWANFIFIWMPILFLFFDVRPLIADPRVYLAAFVPYFVTSLSLFYTSMGVRGYKVRELWLGQALGFNTFWIFMKAAVAAMLGRKKAFGVTPKGVGGSLPISALWPQGCLMLLSYAAGIWGILRYLFLEPALTLLVNVFWAWYHVALFATLFLYFNRPVEVAERPSVFEQYLRDGAAPTAQAGGGE